MTRIILDAKSHQAIRHLGTEDRYYSDPPSKTGKWRGIRLKGFEDALAARGYSMEITGPDPHMLNQAAVLMIAGRADELPFTDPEIEHIAAFWNRGGSLFLMANHKGLVAPQNRIASALRLPVTFNEVTVLSDSQRFDINHTHPTSKGVDNGIFVRTSCTMSLEKGPSVSVLAENRNPDIGALAAALAWEGDIRQRAVVMTSAGHIASCDDSNADLWSSASNAVWTLNILDWLAYRI